MDGESREGDERIWLEVGDRLPNGGIVHAIAYRDEAPKALLEVRLGPRPPPRIAVRRFEGSARTFVVVWIGDIRPFELGEGRHTSRMREVSDSVGDYRKLASEESPPIE